MGRGVILPIVMQVIVLYMYVFNNMYSVVWIIFEMYKLSCRIIRFGVIFCMIQMQWV